MLVLSHVFQNQTIEYANNPHTLLATTFTLTLATVMFLPYFDFQHLDCQFNSLGLCLDPKIQNMEGNQLSTEIVIFPLTLTYFKLVLLFICFISPENPDIYFLLPLNMY